MKEVPTTAMRHKLQSDDVLRGVRVCEIGEAEGHDFTIGREFLEAVVEKSKAGPVKVRVNHPDGKEDLMTLAGEATDFRLSADGDCVLADVRLFDLPEKSRLQTLAREAGHLFGMSLDFAGEVVKKAKKKFMTCESIFALDFVGTPAATRALFSAGDDKKRWRMVCSLSAVRVDDVEQVKTDEPQDNLMNEKLVKLCKKFGIDPKAADASTQLAVKLAEPIIEEKPDGEPDGDEGTKEILAKLSAMESRLAKLEGGKAVELAVDDEKEEDEKTEEKMAAMAAKVTSIMLAKVGIKPRASAPAPDDKKEVTLSADEAKLATSLGIDHKQFAANLATANEKIKRVQV